MPRFRSLRERRLWIAFLVAVVALLAALYPLQFALDALRARNLLRFAIGGVFLSAATLAAVTFARRRAPLRAWLVLTLCGAFYAGLALAMEVPQERLHLVEYGALALLGRAAIAESVAVRALGGRVSSVDVWALGAVTAIGWLDEAIQGILPNRIYDLRDVAFNGLAAALALGSAAVLRTAVNEAPGRGKERAER